MKIAYVTTSGSETVDMTAEQLAAHEADMARLQAIAEADWSNNRLAAYPSIREQLDMQYWDSVNGTTVWADTIAAVKAANPKPE